MIRRRVIIQLRNLAMSLESMAEGCQWYLFGSVDRDEHDAADIDLIILCKNSDQADVLRRVIDPDVLELPLHLSLMTFEEASQVNAINKQYGRVIFP